MDFRLVYIFSCVLVTYVVCQSSTCSTDSDCPSGECCTKRLTARKRFLTTGYCLPLTQLGEPCEPTQGNVPHYNLCPCAAGLVCRGQTEVHNDTHHTYNNPHCVRI